MATKTSIIIFFLSLARQEKIFRWCNYLTLFVVNAAGLALTIVSIVQCRPVSSTFQWPLSPDAKCIDIVALYLSSAPVNIITDLALLFLPMPILTKMRLPKKQKIILVVTFSFGIFVAVVDVVRIAYLQDAAFARVEDAKADDSMSTGSTNRIREESDFSWYAALSFMWTAVEVNIGIIVACVPGLKPLFLRFLPSFIRDEDDQTVKYGSFATGSQPSPTLRPAELDPITNPAAVRKASINGAGSPEDPPPDITGEMGFMDFLAAGERDAPMYRTGTNGTTATMGTTTTQAPPTFYDFVNMNKTKNLLRLTNRESFAPSAIVTILFFLWGFAYGFLNILNQQFSVVVAMTQSQSMGLHASYFAGYFFGPLTLGRWLFKRFGFKATMISALVIYACGTLIFWPSAVLQSYTAYIISNIIVGFGLSILELAANPFIIFCGPLEYAEIRLNLCQGFQAIGSVVSPLLAKKVLFRNVLDAPSLIDVQWTYLAIALFDILLAVALYYIHLPEASDEDLERLSERRAAVNNAKVAGKVPVIWLTLGLGALSQFCYVAGQEGVGTNTEKLINALPPSVRQTLSPFDYDTIGHTVFAVGRFSSAFLNYLFRPRWILLATYLGLIITAACIMRVSGEVSATMLMLAFFFESGVFSIIFAVSLRGLGAHTKTGAAIITAAVAGGAVLPPIQTAISNRSSVSYSFSVVLGFFVVGALFPIYLNFIPQAKAQVDPYHEQRQHRHRSHRRGLSQSSIVTNPELSTKTHAFGFTGIIARYKQDQERYRREEKQETAGKISSHHLEQKAQLPPLSDDDLSPTHAIHDFASDHSPSSEKGSTTKDSTSNMPDLQVLGQGSLSDSASKFVEKGRERELRPASLAVSDTTAAVNSISQQGNGIASSSSENPSSASTLGKGLMHDLEEWPSRPRSRVGTPDSPVIERDYAPSSCVPNQHSRTSIEAANSNPLPKQKNENEPWDIEMGKEVHSFTPWPTDENDAAASTALDVSKKSDSQPRQS